MFGFEFGPVIRGGQVLVDVEVCLGVLATEGTGHRDRGHVVQRRAKSARQPDHRPGALDVGAALGGLGHRDVVDRAAVHDVLDGRKSGQAGDGFVAEAQVRLGQVADQGFRSVAPFLGQLFEACQGRAAHENADLGVGMCLQQFRYDSATNKPGTAGNDIAHGAMVVAATRQVKEV